jgi:hypothetical protein
LVEMVDDKRKKVFQSVSSSHVPGKYCFIGC